jgi:hypothetical protein
VSLRSLGYVAGGLVVLTLAFTGLAVAGDDPIFDPKEPPVRLKKKGKQNRDAAPDKKPEPKDDDARQNDPDKKPDKKADDDPEPDGPNQGQAGEEREELVKRVLKNLDEAEQRLAKNDPGSATRQIQKDIVKDLDSLIEQTKRQPPPQGGRRRQSQQQQKKQQGQAGKNPKNQSGKTGRQPKQGSQGKRPQGGKNQSGKNNGKQKGKGKSNRGGGGNSKEEKEKNNLADLFKDVWGHLPETVRQEMDAYTKARFVPKYDGLLRQYYRSLSEQGRRK